MTKMEIEEKPKIIEEEDIKPKRRRRHEISSDVILERKYKRTQLCVAKPSYLLTLGSKSPRIEYLNELPKILRELLRQSNWNDASRVLSVLMQGTMKDSSPEMNRLKYEAHIQIVSHFESNSKKRAEEIGNIYDTWIGKIGKQHKEERLLVWFEQICHFIDHGMNADAYSAAISLMQNRDFGMLPRTNLYIGITFFKLWRGKFLNMLQPEEEECSESISNMSVSRSDNMVEYPVRDESVYSVESEGSVRNESDSSVKRVSHMSISESGSGTVMKKVKVENSQHFYNNPPQGYASSEENQVSLEIGVARTFDPTLVKILGDMDPWLLPLKPPEDPDCYVKIVNDSYFKEAVRYLRLTLQSPYYVSLVSLHPLIQLLLIGGHVDEAMKVVEEMCNKVHDIKPFRIKALMTERFHPNSEKLAKCYEEILNIDPTCVPTLAKLIVMSKEDGYRRESLIEMIAMHVEASFPEHEIWEEFASCFIHFFENLDEDRMSVCLNGDGEEEHNQHQTYSVRYNPTPKMFTDKSWTLRAKWWLNRHFSPRMLETEMKKAENGDFEMMKKMSYKAACASHIYGREFDYVTKVYGVLENDSDNRELFNFLQEHRQNWNMIYNLE